MGVAFGRRPATTSIARLQLWRLNPVMLTRNLARGTWQALGFLVAMHGERY